MGYRYPNGAFSVILNVENNPYAATGKYSAPELAARTFHLEKSLTEAITMIEKQIQEQRNVYHNIEQYFLEISDGCLDLNNLLKQTPKQTQTTDKEKKEIQQIQEEYAQELNALMFEYKSKYIGYFSKRNQQNYNEIDQEIVRLIEATNAKANQMNKSLQKQLEKIRKAGQQTKESYYGINLNPNGTITINNNSIFIDPQKIDTLARKIGTLLDTHSDSKGKKWTFEIYNQRKNLKGLWRKDKALEEAFSLQNALIEEIEKAFKALDPSFDLKNTRIASEIVTQLLKANLGQSSKMEFQQNPFGEKAIASASGDVFEFSAQAELEQTIEEIIGKANFQALIEGKHLTERTRLLIQVRPSHTKRSKANQKKFDQQKKEIEKAHAKLTKYLDDSIKFTQQKDKIDNYLLIKDKKNPANVNYTLAFSDKLQYNIDNIALLGGKHEETLTSSLLNSLDLIAKLAIPQETFLFSALNSSPASAFYSYGAQENIQNTLKQLLTSLVFEIAYNPDNFTAMLPNLHQHLNFSNNKVLYIHRIGPKIVPSFQILEATLKSLKNIQSQTETMQPINVTMYFGNKNASEFWDAKKANNYKKMTPSERVTEWNYVASQVADSILLQVVMNLSPILFDVEKLNSII